MISLYFKDSNLLKNTKTYKTKLDKIKKVDLPAFAKHDPDFKTMDKHIRKYKKFKNVILIANGGQRTSIWSYYKALAQYKSEKRFFMCSGMDPDYLNYVKKTCKKKDTIVVVSSKSGNTAGVLQILMAFKGYPTFAFTSVGNGALYQIVKKKGWDYMTIPEDIGGRYTGGTASAYFTAQLLGVDVKKVHKGLKKMHKICAPSVPLSKNPALKLALALYEAEKKRFATVFMPIYSPQLYGFNDFILQINHESYGKAGKGIAFLGAEAPESQHHTNQLFFGGPKNMIGLFVRTAKFEDNKTKVEVPKLLHDVKVSKGKLKDLQIPYSVALHFEHRGTQEDAKHSKIPNIVLSVDKVTPISVGEFMGFWHYVAVYSSYLRGVNPFDQPQVENSKNITRELTFGFKGKYTDKYL